MQLFYATGGVDLMAVGINTKGEGPGPKPAGRATVHRAATADASRLERRAPAGDRFLFITTPDGGKPAPYRVVVNWVAALNNR